MPELPEVEVTRMGIEPHIKHQKVRAVTVRQRQLRWPVPQEVELMVGQSIEAVERRAKYLLLKTHKGIAIIHLGMSGKLSVVDEQQAIRKHDHIDIVFENGQVLRYHDPRRFGALLWQPASLEQHQVMQHLGVEPFDEDFDGDYLYQKAKSRTLTVKQFIMDNKIVVGVGNIYASESLFKAGIDPRKPTNTVGLKAFQRLAPIIVETLRYSIEQGGTTLKDFAGADGNPGYYAQELLVYGRQGQPCVVCNTPLEAIRLGQRSTVFCSNCQS